MKKTLLSVAVIIFISTAIFAQNSSFVRNENHSGIKFGGSEIVPRSTVTLTHSASQTIVAATGVHCGTTGTPYHTPNSYWRSYDLSSFGINDDFEISSVQFGVEGATGNSGSQPITVNLYTSSQTFPTGFPASLTLIGTSDMTLTDQALTVASIDISATASAGSELVVEVYTPDGRDPAFNSFYIGANSSGETAPSYISADECDITSPITFASIGFGTCHIVINVLGEETVPVELTSFNATSAKGSVTLNWQTATETNNYGFEIQRSVKENNFVTIGFVNGNGTTTETQSYNFSEDIISSGVYIYRLKQIDLDGTFAYSPVVEVEIAPFNFTLNQNFPNPFNPNTKISFSLPVESNVSLKIFNILGQEVTNLIKGTLGSGNHSINFDASNLNSGIYFYSIEAFGIDGTSFSEVRKMMLTK